MHLHTENQQSTRLFEGREILSTYKAHTILADVKLSQLSEVGNVRRDTHQIILAKSQFSKVRKSEEFLMKQNKFMYRAIERTSIPKHL